MFEIKKFGGYLSKLRKEKRMTQFQLSEKLNITRQTVSKYERGESFPDIQTLSLISKIYDISIDELVSCSNNDFNISKLVEMAPIIKEDILIESLELISKVNRNINENNFNDIDEETIGKLIPFLDDSVKEKIFDKVLTGDINCEILQKLLPYAMNLASLVESAVLDGALEKEILNILNKK